MNCRKCGSHLNEGSRFCGVCGTPVQQPNPAAYPPPQQPRPAAYPPSQNANYRPAPANKSDINVPLLIIILVLILAATGTIVGVLISRHNANGSNIRPGNAAGSGMNAPIQPGGYNTVSTPAPTPTPAPSPTPVPTEAPSNGDYLFNSDTVYITPEYLATQSQSQVRLILNEMYARHGYIFSTQEYRDYFSSKSWYVPRYTSDADAEAHFNSIERQNKTTIVEYEKSKGWR